MSKKQPVLLLKLFSIKDYFLLGFALILPILALLILFASGIETMLKYVNLVDFWVGILLFIILFLLKYYLNFSKKKLFYFGMAYFILYNIVNLIGAYLLWSPNIDNPPLRVLYQIILVLVDLISTSIILLGYTAILDKEKLNLKQISVLYVIGILSLALARLLGLIIIGKFVSFESYIYTFQYFILFEAIYTIFLWYGFLQIKKRFKINNPIWFFTIIGGTSFILALSNSIILSIIESFSSIPFYLVSQIKADSINFTIYFIQGILLFIFYKFISKDDP